MMPNATNNEEENQMPVKHLAVSKPNKYGGYDYNTLCGRGAEKNVEVKPGEITCRLCLRILDNPAHWRYRKWLLHPYRKP